VQLVEGDDLLRLADLSEHGLETLLELPKYLARPPSARSGR
jgi:hypothetical protein